MAARRGVTHVYDFPPGVREKSYAVVNVAGGALAEDLDDDGWVDLVLTDGDGGNALFWNAGGTFVDGTEAAGVRVPGEWTNAVGAADIDNDGDQDVYLVTRGRDRVLRNEGGRRFTEVAASLGLDIDGPGLGVTFGDLDGDRRLDLFVSSTGLSAGDLQRVQNDLDLLDWGLTQSRILQGLPDGTYREVQGLVLPAGLPPSNPFVGGLVDLDADNDLDLYLVEDTQGRVLNALYENRGKNPDTGWVDLVDVSATCGCQYPLAGMGMAVLDYDSNGLPDLYVTNVYETFPNREALLLNRGGLVFQDVTDVIGATAMDPFGEDGPRSVSWGANSLDVQNDTIEDLFVNFGELVFDPPPDGEPRQDPPFLTGQPDALMLGRPDGSYEVQSGSGLEDVGRAHGSVVFDFDRDGCQDVLVLNLETPTALYRNRCNSGNHWLGLDLEGTRSNRDGIGARVRVHALGRTQWRQLTGCVGGAHSCGPKQLHFGLGPAPTVESVEIHWPSGVVQTLSNLAPNRVHAILEPATP